MAHVLSAAWYLVIAGFLFVLYWPLSHLPLSLAAIFGIGFLLLGLREIFKAERGPQQRQRAAPHRR
ncbi:hypothetical protein FHX37_3689 [Haloactinospora alba]|uniref:Uncharacterized protein n=1 Tax=Haloactinospora alba TaxID=405555 RepID=A0A543N947_9ACTN|nr:hypothetical protein [Haloactinospora alba]TQN28352.1 hypothetical protein FHX37_3689 [Haloactinospora alba]